MRVGVATDKWKRTVEDYLEAAGMLATSMWSRGFDYEYAVPVDPDGELLDGSHRIALAAALGYREIPVTHEDRNVWAPPWGQEWFIEHGCQAEDLDRVVADWNLMRQ